MGLGISHSVSVAMKSSSTLHNSILAMIFFFSLIIASYGLYKKIKGVGKNREKKT